MEDRGKQILCHGCRDKFYKDELIQVTKTKRLCKECNKRVQQESEDYKDLIKYICDGFGIKAPTGQQLKSIKEFRELGYSYSEIQYTIYYIFCVAKKKAEGTGIGLVPFYYEKAKKHFELVENAKRTASKISTEEIIVERNVELYQPNRRNTRLVNIEELI